MIQVENKRTRKTKLRRPSEKPAAVQLQKFTMLNMAPGLVNFFVMVFGNTLCSHLNFIDRIVGRLHLCEVNSEEESEIIIAFVAVESRAGTDIAAALQEIPQTSNRPVVLVVLHHTFDPYYVTPNSNLTVNRRDVFAVDCLFYEDQRLLQCQSNDRALKAATDYLLSKGVPAAPPNILRRSRLPQCTRRNWLVSVIIAVIIAVVFVLLIYFLTN
ncbi:hypothetical protein NFI96_012078 [Prochilodus magdalenae]|nr:hypothetical protein NFI96_012078 [Prochilodus magdalenae]